MTFTVTKIRREWSSDSSHRHIEGVCTTANLHYSRREVVDSIRDGNVWITNAGGSSAIIKPITFCPEPACTATPYIMTEPDSTTTNNLENLPDC